MKQVSEHFEHFEFFSKSVFWCMVGISVWCLNCSNKSNYVRLLLTLENIFNFDSFELYLIKNFISHFDYISYFAYYALNSGALWVLYKYNGPEGQLSCAGVHNQESSTVQPAQRNIINVKHHRAVKHHSLGNYSDQCITWLLRLWP